MATLKNPAFPANVAISERLYLIHLPLLEGMTRRSARQYRFSEEDRLDLIAAASLRIAKTDWRKHLRRDMKYIRKNFGTKSSYTLEICQRVLYSYSKTLILNAVIDECKRLRIGGLTGLWLTPIAEMPFQDAELPDEGRDGLPDAQAAKQIYEFAQAALTSEELTVVRLTHGFDGGESRRVEQVMRETGRSRDDVLSLLSSAESKLREKCGLK
jgi:hypothetical protein